MIQKSQLFLNLLKNKGPKATTKTELLKEASPSRERQDILLLPEHKRNEGHSRRKQEEISKILTNP